MQRFDMTLAAAALPWLMSATVLGGVIHVDLDAAPGGSGAAWADAMTDLQDALAAAIPGDEIWVAEGTYVPTLPAGAPTFHMKTGVALYGGFAGDETVRDQRDPATRAAVLTNAAGHVMTADGVDATAVLDGFVVTGGVAPDDPVYGGGGAGGGLSIVNASPTIRDSTINDNDARVGAGVFVLDGSPTFTGCEISANFTTASGEGGGLYAAVDTAGAITITMTDCVILQNAAYQQHFATGHGAGIYADAGVSLVIRGCRFESNYTFHNSTYGHATTGGAISFRGVTADIRDTVFLTNYSSLGAGIYSTGDLTCVNCLFMGNRAVEVGCAGPECNGAPDVYSGYGGGVYAGSAMIDSCTFAGNWAAKTGGGADLGNGVLRNTILWANETYPVCCGEDPLPLVRMQITGGFEAEHCCIAGLLTPEPGEDPIDPSSFPGSHENDPLFEVMPVLSSLGNLITVGDLHLSAGSPCVDAGNNTYVAAGTTHDLDGNPRFQDDPAVPDTGVGSGPIVDMGPYERGDVGAPGDVNGDGAVDVNDLVLVILAWGPCPGCPEDINGDDVVDVNDLVLVIVNWS